MRRRNERKLSGPKSDIELNKLAREFIDLAAFEPVTFQREVLGMHPDPWQVESTEAVFDYIRWAHGRETKLNHEHKNQFTVRSMHGPGKTYWLAGLIHTFGSAFPMARIPCIAPKMDQLKTRLWLELIKVKTTAVPEYQSWVEVNATTMYWNQQREWIAFAQTATKTENIAGLHNPYQLVCCDEASGITEALWPAVFGAITSKPINILVMISNPTLNSGTFADSWLKPRIASDYYHIKIDLEKAPRVDRVWVEKMERKYGRSSPVVQIRCYGEFADASPNQLISLVWIERAILREALDEGLVQAKLRVSVDVADGGEDETVITAAHHGYHRTRLLNQQRFSFPSAEAPIETAKAAERMFLAWGGRKGEDDFVVDSLGVGAGTAGWLLDKGHSVVVYKGGAASDNPTRWRNRRVQSFLVLRDAFRDGTLEFAPTFFEDEADWDDFKAQLCSIEMDPGTERLEDLVTKEEMGRRGIKSPDMADSLAMQFATQAPRLTMSPTARKFEVVTEELPTWSGY